MRWRVPWGLLGVILLLLGAMAIKGWPVTPAPPPAQAVAGDFDARRAIGRLQTVLGPQRPHWADSAESDAVRARLIAAMREVGLSPRVSDDFACNGFEDSRAVACARVRNLVARIGRAEGRALMLVAHYDSAPAGPGAADDGIGVATLLEVAHLLRGRPLSRPVIFLINEGEELGLLGARVFLERDPAAAEVDTVLNIEARGVTGPAIMFETSRPNAGAIALYRAAVSRPVANSLSTDLYGLIPNSTDVNIFRARPWTILNFAIIGNESRYQRRRRHRGARPRERPAHGRAGLAGDRAGARRRARRRAGHPHLCGRDGPRADRAAARGRPRAARPAADLLPRDVLASPRARPAALGGRGEPRRRRRPGLGGRACARRAARGRLVARLAAGDADRRLRLRHRRGAARAERPCEERRARPAARRLLAGLCSPGRRDRRDRAGRDDLFPAAAAHCRPRHRPRPSPAGAGEPRRDPRRARALSHPWAGARAVRGAAERRADVGVRAAGRPRAAPLADRAAIAGRSAAPDRAARPPGLAGRLGRGGGDARLQRPPAAALRLHLSLGRRSRARPLGDRERRRAPPGRVEWARTPLPWARWATRWMADAPAWPGEAPGLTRLGETRAGGQRRLRVRLAAHGADQVTIFVSPESGLIAAGAPGFVRPFGRSGPDDPFALRCTGRSCDGAELEFVARGEAPLALTLVGAVFAPRFPPEITPPPRPADARPQYAPDSRASFARLRL